MAVTPESIRVRFPEYAKVSDARIQMYIDDAALDMGACPSDQAKRDKMQSYLVAHLMRRAGITAGSDGENPGGGGDLGEGRVSKRKVGDVEITLDYGSTEDTSVSGGVGGNGNLGKYYSSTKYGEEYWRLMRKYCGGVILSTRNANV